MDKLVTCKTCGAEIAKSAKQCPQCGAKNRLPQRVLKTALVILGVIILISILFGEPSEPKKVETNNESPATETTLEKNIFALGETADLDNVTATLLSVEPHNGYVLCEFEIGNNTSNDIGVSSLLSFDCYIDDYSTDLDLGALLLDTDKPQLDGAVASGKKMRGVVTFKAPSGWKEIEIHYHPSFWSKAIIFSAIHE